MSRVILHCDMNNFFASVECLLDPGLRNKKIAVCGSREERRGIVLAKNEAAKKFGVTTAEPIWQARRKCPDLVVVSPHYKYYSIFSERAKTIYSRYTDLVEPMGIDECWLDVTKSVRLFGSGQMIAEQIRNSVRDELGLTVSIGVSFNKIFAKLGSDMKKPDAITVIDESNYKDKIYDLSVGELFGVGKSAKESLRRIGIDTIGELASMPVEVIKHRLGKQGEAIWRFATAQDDSSVMPLNYCSVAKSVSRGMTTPKDIETNEDIRRLIISLSISVSRELRKNHLVADGIQITLRDELLKKCEFQCSLSRASNNAHFIASEAYELFIKRYQWERAVHSLTVRAINLLEDTAPFQLSMFYDDNAYFKSCKKEKTVDNIEKRFGKKCIVPMVLLDYNR